MLTDILQAHQWVRILSEKTVKIYYSASQEVETEKKTNTKTLNSFPRLANCTQERQKEPGLGVRARVTRVYATDRHQ